MLTKDQANVVAECLLEPQRVSDLAARNAKAPPIPFYYRCPELKQLKRWQQAQVLRDAKRNIHRGWVSTVGMFAWFAACIAVWYFFVPATIRTSSLPFLAFACIVPEGFVRLMLARREVRKMALQLTQSI